jgi:hypothetical protein
VRILDKDMMAEVDEIVLVGKGQDSLAIFLWDREEIFKNILYAPSKLRAEAVEYEMWVLFRYGRGGVGSDVVP